MTKPLTDTAPVDPGAQRGSMPLTNRIQGAVTSVGVKVSPWIPTAVRRGLVRGRSVIIDGNTLDPTLQLMLSGLRAVGIDGLVVDDDPELSRAQMHESKIGRASCRERV